MERAQRRNWSSFTRRRVIAGISAGGAITALSACGPTEGQPAAGGGRTAKAITGSFTFWPEGGQTNASYQAWLARLDDFRKAYPDAKVEMVETQDSAAKLITAVAAGTPPDVSVYDRVFLPAAQARGIMM